MKIAGLPSYEAYKNMCGLLVLGAWVICAGVAYSANVDSAKAEGELVWWTTMAQDQSQKVVEAFMKRHPSIKATYWRSGSNGMHNKIMTEGRVNRHSWDVVTYTAEFVLELKQKNLIAAYDSHERKN
jgi:ABC-type glycerol-3-phosphate transport system substrate-binding protein